MSLDYGDDSELDAWLEAQAEADVDPAAIAWPLGSDPDVVTSVMAPVSLPIDPGWNARDSKAIFDEPLILPDAVCAALEIQVGRPCGIIGVPGVGKNDMAQGLALAVASGQPAFGIFPVRRGRVIHITYDMGDAATRLRYRRLAAGLGIARDSLEGRIVLAPYPTIDLTSDNARRDFAKLLRGFDMCLLDNARTAIPGVSENDSEFGRYLQVLGVACQAGDNSCAPVYLHHARKDGNGSGVDMLRGSNSIAGASGAIWAMTRVAGARKVEHVRQGDYSDALKPDFYLTETVGGSPRGYDLGAMAPIRLVGSLQPPRVIDAKANVRKAVLEAVTASPGLSKEGLRVAVGAKSKNEAKAAWRSALQDLINEGKIVNDGGADWSLRVTEHPISGEAIVGRQNDHT